MIERDGELQGQRLEPGQDFAFACRPGLACFNTCCAQKRLPLMPYDLLRLRRGLDLTAPEIIERFAELEMDPVSGWPVFRLRLDGRGRCPLLTPDGCEAYAHRPAACRTYPLARAVKADPQGRPAGEVWLRQETPGCLGWGAKRRLTVADWIADQGLAPYQAANDALLPLFCHPRRQGRLRLNQPQIHGVVLALYNLDLWRQAVARPGFAQRQGLDPQRVEAALAADEDLLLLGRDWLRKELFGETQAG
ncbi:MAG: YkgJ family cysteine cluster protein [Thermodesulfobacteriota bacterium]